MKTVLDIVIPTFDNVSILLQCLNSFNLALVEPIRPQVKFWIVNNGKAPLEEIISQGGNVKILNPGSNLGWEGGLKYGLSHCKAPFVAFSNDDIRLVPGQYDSIWRMLQLFSDPNVAAVGPCSNYVMGPQNIFADINGAVIKTKYLIGFFLMLRRADLDAAGGVDDTLPGGDDIDLSIRLRDLGKTLLCRRDVFFYHHGSLTGNREQAGYWNSGNMQEKTNLALIRKHGMKKFYETIARGWNESKIYGPYFTPDDVEGDLCRKHVEGENVFEVGCGDNKTVEHAIGLDKAKFGDHVPFVGRKDAKCEAEINGDASRRLPVANSSQDTIIARHILEHCQDPVGTLAMWSNALRIGGKLIVAVPNNKLNNTVLMNPEHVVSFTPESLHNAASCAGLMETHSYDQVNGTSFVSVFQKVGAPHTAIREPQPTVHNLVAEMAGAA